MGDSDLTVRFATVAEDFVCNDFHNRLYQKSRTLQQWRWEFVSTIFEHPQIPFGVVDDGGSIVGTQALIPIRMINEDGVFWTAKSEETLVDPAYRGKQLFQKMYVKMFEYAAENDLRYIWGFTSAEKAFRRLDFAVPARTSQLLIPFYCRSLQVLLNPQGLGKPAGLGKRATMAGYKCACVMARLVSVLRFHRANRRVRSSSASGDLRVETLQRPPEDAGLLCRRFVEQWGGTTIYRDADYLRWRVFENPYTKPIMCAAYDGDELVGWVIYSIDDNAIGYLIDVVVATSRDRPYTPTNVVRMLLTRAVRNVRDMGAVAIRSWHVNDHPFAQQVTRVAKEIGFYHVRRGFSMVTHSTDSTDPEDFSDWYITRIYTEGVTG